MYYFFIFVFELIVLYYFSRKLTSRIWGLFNKLTKSKKWATYIYSFLFLPGIIFHELSHFLSALFLLVPIGKVSFSPEFNEDENGNIKEIKLGSVSIGKAGLFRGSLIGFAPFIFGVTVILLAIWYVVGNNLLDNWIAVVLMVYLIFVIGNTMFLSKSDLKTALELVLVLTAFYIILYLFGVRVSIDPQNIFNQTIVDILKTADKFLLIPLGIDYLLYSLAKIFKF